MAAVVPAPVGVAVAAAAPAPLPDCASIVWRSAENACMNADTLLLAVSEPVLVMLSLAGLVVAVVVAFEPALGWLCHCHQFW